MTTAITIRFPSGASDEQVRKDAKKIRKTDPALALHVTLDIAAKNHGATAGYKQYITDAHSRQKILTGNGSQANGYRKIRYCAKCERFATHDLGGIPKCAYHADPDMDESDIPPHRGEIPDDAICAEKTCDETPTQIYGGACFCPEHYLDAKRGHRYRRNVFNVLGIED
jgi:hypothetical protein